MKQIKRDNASISYEISGKGEITLFFVHGSYLDHTSWRDQVAYFENRYAIVTIDLPGHGQSGKERTVWTLKSFAEDVNAVIRQETLKNVILIGHSMGAEVNLLAATLYPEPIIGFIAVDNFKNAGMPLAEQFQEQAKELLKKMEVSFSDTGEAYARMALLTPATPHEVADEVVTAYRNAFPSMGIPITQENFEANKIEATYLPRLGLKLHLINVDYINTNEVPLKNLLGVNYELHHMQGTCHFPMLENPAKLCLKLEETIEEISSVAKPVHHAIPTIPR